MPLVNDPTCAPGAADIIQACIGAGDLNNRGAHGTIFGGGTIRDHRKISSVIKRDRPTVVVVPVAHWPDGSEDHLPSSTFPEPDGADNRLCFIRGKFTILGVNCNMIVVLGGSDAFRCYASLRVKYASNVFLDPAEEFQDLTEEVMGSNEAGTCLKPAVYNFYMVSPKQLVILFLDQTIPFLDKVLSAYWAWMPMAKPLLLDLCVPLPIPDTVIQNLATRKETSITDVELMVTAGIGLLSPAYSIKANMPRQIEGRLKAICAAANVAPPTSQDVSSMFTRSQADAVEFPNPLSPILCSVVCVSIHKGIDPDVQTDHLVKLSDWVKTYSLSFWQMEMIAQLRLVFSNFRATSLKFGISFEELYSKYFVAAGGRFRQEITLIRRLRGELENRNYTGMASKIADGHQIKNISRGCYVALLYYKRTLTTQADKDNFAKYAVDSVKAHIDPVSDVDICQNIVDVLPEKNIVAAAMLGQHLSYDDMDTILVKYTNTEQTLIYKTLINRPNPGPWATERKKQIEEAAYQVFLEGALSKLAGLEKEKQQTLEAKIRFEQNPEIRNSLTTEFNSWKDRVFSIRRRLVRLEDIVAPIDAPDQSAPRSKAILAVKDLFNAIQENQDDSDDDSDEADQESDAESHGGGQSEEGDKGSAL